MKENRHFRNSFAAVLLLLVSAGLATSQPPRRLSVATTSAGTFESTVKPFLKTNCQTCHSAKVATAGLNIETLAAAGPVEKDRDRWQQIASKIADGEMPPPGMPRPNSADLAAVTSWFRADFARQDKLIRPDAGHIVARRLNRAEYNNTIRDLTGVSFRPGDDFPQDDSGYGFDNIGDVLSLSPALMEKYLSAAEKVSRAAIFGDAVPKPALDHYQPHLRRPPPPKELFRYDETGLSLPGAINKLHVFPVDGEYLLKFVLNGQQPAASEPRTVAVWIDGKEIQRFDIENTIVEGQSRQTRTRISRGEHLVSVSYLRYFEGLPPMYGGPNPSKKPTPPGRGRGNVQPAATIPGAPGSVPPSQAAPSPTPSGGPVPIPVGALTSRVESLDIGGPFDARPVLPAESHRLIFTCRHNNNNHDASCPRKIIADFTRRAYRRPVTAPEIDSVLALYSKVRGRGDSFEEGIAVALQYVLVSPDFLFRMAGDARPKARPSRVSQYETASRLSYFLWSSMPDDELLGQAARGKLQDTAVLDAQVRRMLKDPKAEALVDNFAGQWLEIRNMDIVKPDPELFMDFDDLLRISMKRETKLFLSSIIKEDRSILDIVSGKYTFLNGRLARFYKIPGVEGMEFRKVDLTGNPERSGLLTQASVLTVSSYATRTSPVLRGKWILENILNTPPPPPPPDVPPLAVAASGNGVSLRQQMEKHRENPLCASCHGKMDPLGFSLENYDAIGAWRTQDGTATIDASGKLPDGRNFSGPDGLKAMLLSDPNALARTVTEKLLIYALGRGLERFDKPVVASIAKRAAVEDYRFSSIVLGIVHSMPFEMKRGDQVNNVHHP